MTLTTARQVLTHYFGYSSFRPLQAEIIECVLNAQDTLVLMPTGGGKSICYQVPALVMEGLCVVVSPLIALMKDQVEGLKANGVEAAFLNSSLSAQEQVQIERLVKTGNIKLLYVSPEKLLSPSFFYLLDRVSVSLFAIDEAHCISAWGHDFRQEYTKLSFIKERFPHIPIIALTATADKTTRQDISKQLHLDNPKTFIASFDRPNLSLNVLPGQKRLQTILNFLSKRPKQSGIIYCLSRKSTESLAQKLNNKGYDAIYYHAGMSSQARATAQEDFINDRIPIVCATLAFGMGIDKSNVRWVIHYNLPKNIESYYQEIGRAGRDGLKSDTLLFYTYADVITLQSFAQESGQAELQQAKLKRMQAYAESQICRRKTLLSYFGEVLTDDCGNCDVCKNPPQRFDGTVIAQKALSAIVRLREHVGTMTLIDVLRGSQKQEIYQKGYHAIKTYGLGKDISFNDWRAYIQQMIQLGLIEIAYDNKHTLRITEFAKEVLFSAKKIQLIKPSLIQKKLDEKVAQIQRKTKKQYFSEELFEELVKQRKAFANQQGVPPYVIFNDASLQEMANKLPCNTTEFRGITGVGDHKMSLYASDFIDTILAFVQQKNLEQGTLPAGVTALVTWKYYLDGLSIANIAEERGLSTITIYSHLAVLYEKNCQIDLFQYLTREELIKITTAIDEQFDIKTPLRDIFVFFNEKMPYYKIRLAMAYYKKHKCE